ncbi:MAG: hypothetical protein QOH81_3462 [Sphingomonadales bacterium]|jgi:hypothetical protein|nr:hypothetical protein [Sphingomonadales bacterium]
MTPVLLLAAAGLGGFALPQGEAWSWCQQLPTRNHVLQELKDVRIEYVGFDRLNAAVRMLSTRSVVRLGARTYVNLVGKSASPQRGDFTYLVRAGFMAPEGLAGMALAREGRKPWYATYEDDGEATASIVSLLTAYNQMQVPTGYPLILISPRPIKNVTVTCIGGA